MIRKFFKWVFKSELDSLQNKQAELDKSISQQQDLSRILTKQFDVLQDLQKYKQALEAIFGCGTDVGVDVHYHSRSWACISLQGEKRDYIKFIDLGDSDLKEIGEFLRSFEKSRAVKVDGNPFDYKFLKTTKNYEF